MVALNAAVGSPARALKSVGWHRPGNAFFFRQLSVALVRSQAGRKFKDANGLHRSFKAAKIRKAHESAEGEYQPRTSTETPALDETQYTMSVGDLG